MEANMNRYSRNLILSDEDHKILTQCHVCIIGCGGVGGYVFEMLLRLGVGEITIVDGDVFDESNLNSQVLSHVDNLGDSKVEMAYKRSRKINPDVKVNTINTFFNKKNGCQILSGADIVIDALDEISIRKVLQLCCEETDIPLIHGAVAGWYGEVTTIYPGERTLNWVYPTDDKSGIEDRLGNQSFAPALIASIEVSEAIKIMTGKGDQLRGKILYVNLLNNEFNIVSIQ